MNKIAHCLAKIATLLLSFFLNFSLKGMNAESEHIPSTELMRPKSTVMDQYWAEQQQYWGEPTLANIEICVQKLIQKEISSAKDLEDFLAKARRSIALINNRDDYFGTKRTTSGRTSFSSAE